MGSIHSNRIETLLNSRSRPTPGEMKGELARLWASLKERGAQGSSDSCDFFSSAVATLSKLKGLAHVELRMECLFSCATFFYTQGFFERAIDAARLLEALASTSRDPFWVRRANTILGVVLADVGDFPSALVYQEKALTLARLHGDRINEIRSLNNLGGALMYGGLTEEAMMCFQFATRNAKAEGMHELAADALANVAQLHLHNEEYSKGLEAISTSLAAVGEPSDAGSALNRTIREFVFVQLALGAGQLEQARQHLLLCMRFSNWNKSLRSEFLASVARGLCEIHTGNVSCGIAQLEDALGKSHRGNHFKVTCLTALVKGCEEANQPEKALHYMHMLLAHVRANRAESALSLMKLGGNNAALFESPSQSQEISVLERREFKLRAQVAEREAATFRIEMLERLAVTADLKDDVSGEHGYRVGKLASLLADEINWNRDACISIELAARLHDIGKIGVPDRILLTSQVLKAAERHFLGTHTSIGAELLAKSNVPQLRMAEDVARFHHEWWDGNGYPAKISGKRIPIHARIVALADVFDALTHGRPYAAPWTIDQALEEIRSKSGTQFDPELTDRFVALVQRLRNEHEDLDAFLAKAALNSPFAQARKKIRSMLTMEQENERKASERTQAELAE